MAARSPYLIMPGPGRPAWNPRPGTIILFPRGHRHRKCAESHKPRSRALAPAVRARLLERGYGLNAQLRYVDWWRREAWDALGFLYLEKICAGGGTAEHDAGQRQRRRSAGAGGCGFGPLTPGHVVRTTTSPKRKRGFRGLVPDDKCCAPEGAFRAEPSLALRNRGPRPVVERAGWFHRAVWLGIAAVRGLRSARHGPGSGAWKMDCAALVS